MGLDPATVDLVQTLVSGGGFAGALVLMAYVVVKALPIFRDLVVHLARLEDGHDRITEGQDRIIATETANTAAVMATLARMEGDIDFLSRRGGPA